MKRRITVFFKILSLQNKKFKPPKPPKPTSRVVAATTTPHSLDPSRSGSNFDSDKENEAVECDVVAHHPASQLELSSQQLGKMHALTVLYSTACHTV